MKLKQRKKPDHRYFSLYIPNCVGLNTIKEMLKHELDDMNNGMKPGWGKQTTVLGVETLIKEVESLKELPENGIAIFVEAFKHTIERNVKTWKVVPPKPIKYKIYWCDDKFETEHLEELMVIK